MPCAVLREERLVPVLGFHERSENRPPSVCVAGLVYQRQSPR